MSIAAEEIHAFFLSMLPVIELRGGILYAAARDIPFVTAFVICLIGNILPIPFILLFTRRVFKLLERFRYTEKMVHWLENKARKKGGALEKYQLWGLFMLVAIPLPGTGAWTGALVATLFDLQIRRSFPTISLGVVAAGLIMSLISYLIPGLFFPVG